MRRWKALVAVVLVVGWGVGVWLTQGHPSVLRRDTYPECARRRRHGWLLHGSGLIDKPRGAPEASAALRQAFAAYARRHAAILDDTSLVPASERRYLVWTARAGLANRMISLSAAYVMALLTDRALLIDFWDVNVHDVFCEPPFAWDYNLFVDSQKSALGVPVRLCFRGECVFPPSPGPDDGSLISALGTQVTHRAVYLQGYDGEEDVYSTFRCGDLDSAYPEQFVYLFTTQNFVPLLWENPRYRGRLETLFGGDAPTIAYHVVHYLFHPVDPVADAIRAFQEAHFASGRSLSVQIRPGVIRDTTRLFDDYETGAEMLTDRVIECLEHQLPATDTATDDTADHDTAPLDAIFVASMHKHAKMRVRKRFGDAVVSYGGFKQLTDDVYLEGTRGAVIDMWLLASADDMLLSPFSTFGYIAQTLSHADPLVLALPLPEGLADPQDKPPKHPCARVPHTEPCFHAQKLYLKHQNIPSCPASVAKDMTPLPSVLDPPRGHC